MHYKLIISERAELHIDNILDYVVNNLKNPILYRVKGTEVHISGVFHMRENYAQKL